MPPPMSSRSTVSSRLSMTPSLSETFEPPSTTTYGRSGSPVSWRSTSTSAHDQVAGGVRQPLRHVVDAGVLAVHRAEPVADVRRRRARRAGRRTRRARRRPCSLARVEAQVLEQRDVAVAEPVDGGLRARRRRCRWRTRPAGRAARRAAAATGARVYSSTGSPFGPAEVRADDDPRAAVGEVGDGRRAGPDPAVVGDRRAVERHVEVGADEDALAAQVAEVVDGLHVRSRQSDWPTSFTRSTRRLE